MQEVTEKDLTKALFTGDLNLTPHNDIWDRLCPAEWKNAHKAHYQCHEMIGPDGNRSFAMARMFGLYCESTVPSDEEVAGLIQKIKEVGTPVAFLGGLSTIQLVYFPEDKDPTVREFLEGNFDQLAMTTRTLALIYAHFTEK